MKRFGSNILTFLFTLLSLLPTGCTVALWDHRAKSFCEPAANPNLALFETGPHSDVLVEYSALSDRHDNILRLAYFSGANQKRIAAGKAPHFTNPRRSLKMQPIPLASLSVVTNTLSPTNSFATVSTNQRNFTLYRPGHQPEKNELPFYEDDHDTLERVALTPVAVAVDATIVGAVVAVIAGYCYAAGQSGGDPVIWH